MVEAWCSLYWRRPLDKTNRDNPGSVFQSFNIKRFRASAFGYFDTCGKCFLDDGPLAVPAMTESTRRCVVMVVCSDRRWISAPYGAVSSQRWGSGRVAFVSLLISGTVCLITHLLGGA